MKLCYVPFMVSWLLIMSLSVLCLPAWAQTINGAEYFFDTDPGVGLGTSIALTDGQLVDINAEIDLTGLPAGFHTLFVRVRDSGGKWSLSEKRPFLIQAVPVVTNNTIAAAEYFFDTDPGVGKGKALTISNTGQVDAEIDLSKEGLSAGVHTLFVRVKDSGGRWGLQENRKVLLYERLLNTQIVAAEYYFDTENPAPGQGKPLSVTPGINPEINAEIDLRGLTEGNHTLTIRVKDNEGNWSDNSVKEFTKDPNIPVLLAATASGVSADGASLKGTVNAKGATASVAFQYSTDFSYNNTIAAVPSQVTGTTDTPVSATLSGLASNTAYNYRVMVIVADDTLYSSNETFTTLLETIPPTVALLPADDAIDAPIFTDLVLTFNEPVDKGTGTVIIKQQGALFEEIDVSSTQVILSENDTKVTITPSTDFNFEAAITVEIPAGAFKDKSGNDFGGTTAATWSFTTLPPITIEAKPESMVSDATNLSASVKVNYPAEAIKEVAVYTKSITRPQWKREVITAQSGTLYATALPATIKDEIGLEYYFEVVPYFGPPATSEKALVNITYTDLGLSFDDLVFGAQKADYQIISIPLNLTNKSVSAVFEDDLNTYNEEKWRLFYYENEQLKEYKKGFTEIEPGKAYLLIIKDQATVNTGPGSTLRHNDDNPFLLKLKKGWNLIGNPYNLNLSWEEIEKYNGKPEDDLDLPGIGNLKVWTKENGYQQSDRLNKFSGGIVYCDCTSGEVTLKLPVARNTTYNGGRVAAEESTPRHYTNSLFETSFILQTKELSYHLGGLGMHPEAQADKDGLDEVGLPKILHYLQVNFAHPEHHYGRFTKDMVPVEENKVWEFTTETNLTPQEAILQWENYFAQSTGKQLFLYDMASEQITDMQARTSYRFYLNKERRFKVYYGDAAFMAENLKPARISLLTNTPNPFSEKTTISFALPESKTGYQVELQVYDAKGSLVVSLSEGKYQAGFHQLTWNGTNSFGQRLPAGLYAGKVNITSDTGSKEYSLKMILR